MPLLPLGAPRIFARFFDQTPLVEPGVNFLKAHLKLLAVLNEFNLVALGCVNEGNDRSTWALVRTVGQRVSEGGRMARKGLDVVDFKRQVRQIGSYLDRSAGIKLADLDKFLALRRLEENQLRATSAGDAPDLFEPKHVLVEVNGLIEVGDAVARVIQFLNHTHESNCESQRCLNAKLSSSQERPLVWHPDAG
jgi:hypothetical protein